MSRTAPRGRVPARFRGNVLVRLAEDGTVQMLADWDAGTAAVPTGVARSAHSLGFERPIVALQTGLDSPMSSRYSNGMIQSRRLGLLRHRIEKAALLAVPQLANSVTLPRFLGIGVQKSATSWLHANLILHPDLFLPASKELHYFDRHFQGSLRSYGRNFAGSGERVPGEITPSYSTLDSSRVRFIHRMMPDARLIMLLRNPVDRAWSQLKMRQQVAPGEPMDIDALVRQPVVAKRSDYMACLDTWLSHYDREQLLIGYFEQVQEEPEALLGRILEHVGVNANVDTSAWPVRKKVNARPSKKMPADAHRFLSAFYRPQITALHNRLGTPIEPWLESLTD